MDGIIWFSARGLIATSPILCFKEIQLSTKITVLPSGTFCNELRILKILPRQLSIVERVINLARERWKLRA